MLDYDPSRDALFHPEQRATLLEAGTRPTEEAMGVEFARLAYLRFEQSGADAARLQDALQGVGFGKPALMTAAATGTQAFATLREIDGLAIVAFRGTEPDALKDLLTDARFGRVAFRAGHVHGGFLRAYRAVHETLLAWLDETKGRRTRFVACGHSLGAALATLCAVECGADRLVAIGSPRTGDQAFADSLDGVEVTRIVDCCDAITEMPPALFGYAHAGGLRYITHDGRLVDRPSPAEIEADRAIARWQYATGHMFVHGTSLIRELQDHAPINYVRAFF